MLQKKSNGNEAAKYIRIAVLFIYDILAMFLAEIISIWTRFEFSLKNEQCIPYLETAVRYFWINVCVTLVIFAIMHLYNSLSVGHQMRNARLHHCGLNPGHLAVRIY